jgi:L-phenylalanine/L-methionine N-acetyltransferase
VSEITIRATEPADAEAIHEIMTCPGVVANTLQIPWRALDFHREWTAHPQPGRYSFVALVDGRVVGNLSFRIEPAERRRDVAKFGMAVHDDYQGRGVGSALMVAMLELADNWLGLRRIELEVWADNAAAVHLYEKFGFGIEGTGRQYARRAGALADAYYMARLREP